MGQLQLATAAKRESHQLHQPKRGLRAAASGDLGADAVRSAAAVVDGEGRCLQGCATNHSCLLGHPTEVKHLPAREIKALEGGVGHQKHQQISVGEQLLKAMELDGGVIVEVGFAGEHIEASHHQLSGDMEGGGFAQVVYIRLESQA